MLSEVPEGWVTTSVGNIATINQDSLPSSTPPDFQLKYVSIDNVSTGSIDAYSSVAFVDAPSRARRCVKKGDVILSTVRPHLRAIAYIDADQSDLVVSTGFAVLRSGADLDEQYLYQLMLSGQFIEHLKNLMVGSNYPAVKAKDIASFSISLPPLPEQKRIAEILSSVDESIQASQSVIDQAERVKKGLMEDLLTGGLGSEAIARGDVPEGWTSLKALDVAGKAGLQTGPFGSQLKAGEYLTGWEQDAVRVVMPKDILFGVINFETAAMISDKRAVPLDKHRLRMGDALFARRGDLSKVAVYDDSAVPAICGTGCLRLRPSPELVDFRFLAFLIGSESSVEWLKRNAVGATMPNLNTEIIGNMPLILPPLKEQKRIGKILTAAQEFIAMQKSIVEQQTLFKRGLMDDLLTGKVRAV